VAVLSVDIGGTHIRTATFEAPDRLLSRAQVKCSEMGIPLPVPTLVNYLKDQLEQAARDDEVKAIGISIAAVVDHSTGAVKVSENLGWKNVPLKEILEKEIDLPVAVDTDAFCGAEAEVRLGSARDRNHALYVTVGTGIGHALVINRQVWRGEHAAANVFGHIKALPDGEPCYCGGRGCVCQYAAGRGIARLGQIALSGGSPALHAEDVIAAHQRSESWATRAITEAHERLAFALSAFYNLLDVECVILAGGITVANYPNLELLHRLIEPLVYPQIRPIVLRYATYRQDAALLGAALLAMEEIR